MRLKNQLFMNAFDWLVSQGKVKDQKDFAAHIGVSENTITRIKDDANQVSDKTIRMMNKAFDNIFNIGYFKGEELFMLVEEKIYYTMHPEESPFYQPDKNPHESTSGENLHQSSSDIDHSSMVNAMLAAKDETIAAKDETIKAKDNAIAEKEQTIAAKDETIKGLKAFILSLQSHLQEKEKTLAEKNETIASLRQQLASYRSSGYSSMVADNPGDNDKD